MKEFFRKRMVALKRSPQIIPGLFLVITFLIYSLRLRVISDTTARINMSGMGLCGFITMLFSMLCFICFLNAFPKRKNTNIPMLLLFFVMMGAIIACDQVYLARISQAITKEIADKGSAGTMLSKSPFIWQSYQMLNTHVVFVIITVVLTLLLPVYGRLLRKVKTSVEVEGNEDIAQIEIAED